MPPDSAASERTEEGVLDQVCFRLDDAKFRQFGAIHETSSSANSGLERLMSVKAPWR